MKSANSGKLFENTGKMISIALSEEMDTKPLRESMTAGGSLKSDNNTLSPRKRRFCYSSLFHTP